MGIVFKGAELGLSLWFAGLACRFRGSACRVVVSGSGV